ncbi:hypothetical protein IKN40_08690 [bacterium]|nr:hypothetical protein [bacterium]
MATQLSHLPHIKNVNAGMGRWDPMHQSIFEIAFTVPAALSDAGFTGEDLEILTQQVVSVSGLDALQRVAAASSQKFLGVDVSFLNPVLESTTAELTVIFNLNLRDVTDAYVLRLFKEWGRLSYDIGNGHRSLKKDYICETMHISEANRDGTVWREVILKDVFITSLAGLDTLDYSSSEARQLTVTFRADYWEEKTDNYEIGTDA